jgi:threonine dehydrogenase-like Zn-dependent dehydrogenase
LRVLLADANAIKVGTDLPDERYLFLSDILPTALQAVQYAELPERGVLGIVGLGPVGQLAARIAMHFGHRVIAVDPVAERRMMARKRGVEVLDVGDDTLGVMLDLTEGRGPDAMIDAVGMEADGDPAAAFAQSAVSMLPDPLAKRMARSAGVDRMSALLFAVKAVARGGTISIAGVYGGAVDRMPMFTLFDKHATLRMGQCNVHSHWPQLLPLVEDPGDPLGVADLVTHRGPLEHAPELFDLFARREGGCVKVVLNP